MTDNTKSAAKVDVIDEIEPLDAQMGAIAPLSVPQRLQEPLFGGADDFLLNCYAILDACRVMHLAEQLEESGLEHRCLFTGAAYDELKDAAPWIVRLEQNSAFTRNLFTRGKAAWHLWDSAPGIFLRTRADLQQMWRHARKFTRVQDEGGKWFYLRFWDPGPATWYFTAIRHDAERVGQWLHLSHDQRLDILTLNPETARLHIFRPVGGFLPNRPFRLDRRERAIFQQQRWARFLTRLSHHLAQHNERFAALALSERLNRSNALAQQAYGFDIRVERAVADFAVAATLSDGGIDCDPICQRILAGDDHPLDKASAVLHEAKNRLARPQ